MNRCLLAGLRKLPLPVLVLAVAMAACAGGASAEAGDQVVVEMFDNRYDPAEIRIPVGGSVTFAGAGLAPHNAVAADGSWSTESAFGSLEQFEGDSATLSFDQPGEYTFFCTFHGNAEGDGMAGRLVVGDPGASAAAQGADDTEAPEGWTGVTRRVPQDHATIQAAVDAADPGDLVLIDRGVYAEQVSVVTPGLVIRGVDRNETIIDGEFVRENGIQIFGADGVAVENLTVRNTMGNGLFWTGVRGYRASYVTSVDARVYGIYAFDSSDGLFEHSYASGSYDAGFYIGQCDPCEAVIADVVAEWNGLGYSGSNASSELYLIRSVWRHNGSGIVPNTIDGELLPPFHDVTIVGNLVHDNGNRANPTGNSEWVAWGNGILLAGGNTSLVERNRVVNHPVAGILIPPNLDRNFWMSQGNVVRDNVVEGSGRADLALAGPAGTGNCFQGNDHSTSLPPGLEVFQSCDGPRLPWLFELGGSTEQLGRALENGLGLRPDPPHGSAPKPGPQPQMPGGAEAPVAPAVDVLASYPLDLAALQVPDLPAEVSVTQSKGFTMFGVLFASATSVFFGLYAYFLPFVLYAAWVAIALWDLARRDDLSRGATIGWIAVVLVVPFLGVIAYHVLAKSPIPAWQRAAVVGGGLVAYLVIFVTGALVGGVV
ncbi:MAG: right-handed parallel beta-helix repeat-containing protein [Acidimicrobiia bacterium]|nr:right-handed parallel beta-helix repeat-containing protein [Acidimicrobiia bacterium]